jgi:hypothetical protein
MVLQIENFAHPEIPTLKKQINNFLINKSRDQIIEFECSNNIAWIIWDDGAPDRIESLNKQDSVTSPLPRLPQETDQSETRRRNAPYLDKSC